MILLYCIEFCFSCLNNWDCIDTITLLVSLSPYFFLFVMLRPKITCEDAYIEEGKLKIKIRNSSFFKLINANVEACAIQKSDGKTYTYHFSLDHSSFLILFGAKFKYPGDSKIFVANDISERLKVNMKEPPTFNQLLGGLINKDYTLRVRVYGTNSISGLGKAFEFFPKLSSTNI